MKVVAASDLEDLRGRIQSARDGGRAPTMLLITAQSWFQMKALYVEQTGVPQPTIRDVFGVDGFFIEDGAPYVVHEN
jgi:hypothetical protein